MSDDFKLVPIPELASDSMIAKLMDDHAAKAIGMVREIMHKPPLSAAGKRAFDLSYEYQSFAPKNQAWSCIDLNTYDGAPDSEGVSHFIGRGPTEQDAKMELLELFADYDQDLIDNPPPKVRTRTVHHSAFEPPEVIEDRSDDGADDGEYEW